jgi:hypothetical protein
MPHFTGAIVREDMPHIRDSQDRQNSVVPQQTVIKNRRKAYLDRHGEEYFTNVELELEGERSYAATRATFT